MLLKLQLQLPKLDNSNFLNCYYVPNSSILPLWNLVSIAGKVAQRCNLCCYL
jgi:hypothetical protein